MLRRVYMHVRRYGSRECEGGIRYTCVCGEDWRVNCEDRSSHGGSVRGVRAGHGRSDGGPTEGCQMQTVIILYLCSGVEDLDLLCGDLIRE